MRTTQEPRRLYRSREDRRIAGVLAGIAEFFHIDATWARLFFVIFSFIFMIVGGILLPSLLLITLYGVAWFIIPLAPHNVAHHS